MNFIAVLVLALLPSASGVDLLSSASLPLTETITVPDHIPCCEDLPALTSLGLLSQSVIRRYKMRCVVKQEDQEIGMSNSGDHQDCRRMDHVYSVSLRMLGPGRFWGSSRRDDGVALLTGVE
ncbi:uncharacterized protein PHACADRAFT_258018 [Phanerochaete carnosa HHB-10118-sp]|uniref:Uncharacterized protein n=1 Tax=Phanerochaete carnosa (strain HHB-10118-sp) TaxID=650164 RepID=K5W569_PHACS|nr:uncharacterized protein PHACADRAFT_258018 [Phanerochaete carnosa HHB-10118-sp]EKM54275.1 hypothetical protein PHACADRAFT_258018 [Phanerochaete carnosa HHB-10118-sp]